MLRDSSCNPALLSSEFCEPACLILQQLQPSGIFLLTLLRAEDSAWPNIPDALRTRSQLPFYRQATAMWQKVNL